MFEVNTTVSMVWLGNEIKSIIDSSFFKDYIIQSYVLVKIKLNKPQIIGLSNLICLETSSENIHWLVYYYYYYYY